MTAKCDCGREVPGDWVPVCDDCFFAFGGDMLSIEQLARQDLRVREHRRMRDEWLGEYHQWLREHA